MYTDTYTYTYTYIHLLSLCVCICEFTCKQNVPNVNYVQELGSFVLNSSPLNFCRSAGRIHLVSWYLTLCSLVSRFTALISTRGFTSSLWTFCWTPFQFEFPDTKMCTESMVWKEVFSENALRELLFLYAEARSRSQSETIGTKPGGWWGYCAITHGAPTQGTLTRRPTSATTMRDKTVPLTLASLPTTPHC